MLIEAWTDGSCPNNAKVKTEGPQPGGWGVVLRCAQPEAYKELSGHLPLTTNQQAEMHAILEVISAIKALGASVTIYTDSQCAIGWLSKGWKCKTPAIGELRDVIKTIARAKSLKVTFVHVKGHNGNVNNERADELASSATQQ